jgi:TolB-like protein
MAARASETTLMSSVQSDDGLRGSPQGIPRGQRLDSWKEIGAYLQRDVATVRRWEKLEGLPVHRHRHQKLGSVYAFTSELDAWSHGRQQIDHHPPTRPPVGAGSWAGSRIVLPSVLLFLALAVTVSGYVWRAAQITPRRPVDTSLAVLPFQPLGDGTGDKALELGMADALITRLGNVSGIHMRPTSAILKYTDLHSDAEAAGHELRVDAVVEGKIQRTADRIRVTVQLVRVQDGASLWADTFDEQFTSIFAVQDSISYRIARALPLTLSREDTNRLRGRETTNAQAYEFYLKGRYFLSAGVGDSLRMAADYFEQAIKVDPNYAMAYAGLADAFAAWANSTISPSKEAYLNARAAALKGLELDDKLADAHTTLGVVSLAYDWDWPAAEQSFKRAIALAPDDARAHRRYALGLMWLGRFDEATREIRQARDLAPVDLEINASLALIPYFARRYDDAIAEARKTLEMNRSFSQAYRTIARASVEKRLYKQAIIAYQQAIAAGGIQLLKAELGHAYAMAGQRGEALEIRKELEDLAQRRYVSPFDMAILNIGLGDKNQALAWLEKSYTERERWMVQLKVAPVLDPLRSDPRFDDLVRRVGLWQ